MTIRSLSTRVPPVTALRSPPLSRMTGADSPVMADSSTLAIPSMTSPSPGMMSSASQTTTVAFLQMRQAGTLFLASRSIRAARHRRRAHSAQVFGLRFAAAFRHRFGKIGEEEREPEPERDLKIEAAEVNTDDD